MNMVDFVKKELVALGLDSIAVHQCSSLEELARYAGANLTKDKIELLQRRTAEYLHSGADRDKA